MAKNPSYPPQKRSPKNVHRHSQDSRDIMRVEEAADKIAEGLVEEGILPPESGDE